MLSLFRTNQSYISLLLYGYALVLQLPLLVYGQPQPPAETMSFIGGAIYHSVYSVSWLPLLLPVLLTGTLGLVVNRLSDQLRHARTVTQFPGLFVVLLWGVSPAFRTFDPIQIAHLFLAFCMLSLGNVYKNAAPEVPLFNAGIWLGAASLLLPQYLLLLPAFVVAIGLLRTADPRTVIQFLIGTLLLYFLATAYSYFRGDLAAFVAGQWGQFQIGELQRAGPYALLGGAALGLALVIVLFASGSIRSLLNIEGSKNVTVVYWFLLLSALLPAFGAAISVADAQVLVLPVGLLLGLWVVRISPSQGSLVHLLFFTAAFGLTLATVLT